MEYRRVRFRSEFPQQLPGHHRAGRRRRTRGGAGLPAAVLLASGGAGEVRSGADRRAADVLPGLYHGLLSQRVRAVPAALADPASARPALRLGGARPAVAPAAADPAPRLPPPLAGTPTT